MKYITKSLTPEEAKDAILKTLSKTATIQAQEALDLARYVINQGEPVVVGQDPAKKKATGPAAEESAVPDAE